MIRKVARFFRFATKAERLLLGYQACGYSETEVLERWRDDLSSVINGSADLDAAAREWDECAAQGVNPTGYTAYVFRRRPL